MMTITISNQTQQVQNLTTWNQDSYQSNFRPLLQAMGIDGPMSWTGYSRQGYTLTYSFQSSHSDFDGTGALNGYIDEASVESIDSSQHAYIEAAMQTWSHYANITFVEDNTAPELIITETSNYRDNDSNLIETDHLIFDVINDPNNSALYSANEIELNDVKTNGLTFFDVTNSTINNAEIILQDAWIDHAITGITDYGYEFGTEAYSTYSAWNYFPYETVIHEVGHALGLSHPDGNAGNASYTRDTTLMSGNRNGQIDDSIPIASPMIYDIEAVQFLYGISNYESGNTVIGMGGNAKAWTLWDAGGTDEIIYTGTEDALIDLRGGIDENGNVRFSTVGEEMMAIAFDPREWTNGNRADPGGLINGEDGVVDIEIATTSAGNDTIYASDEGSTIASGGGNDELIGGLDSDALYGGFDNDTLYGGSGGAGLYGGEGGNNFRDESGFDTYHITFVPQICLKQIGSMMMV